MFFACQKASISASCLCLELNIATDTLLDITDQGKKEQLLLRFFRTSSQRDFSKDREGVSRASPLYLVKFFTDRSLIKLGRNRLNPN